MAIGVSTSKTNGLLSRERERVDTGLPMIPDLKDPRIIVFIK